ncbi:hypothetical protein FQN54_001718 [Arachnomyces sp. PD_36]|nr:hypothetical protein FQN54_001718 [Arachnomyces sp. PD_36]
MLTFLNPLRLFSDVFFIISPAVNLKTFVAYTQNQANMMASKQFQLFPPPSPRTRANRNPFRKEQKKASSSSRGASPSNEDVKPDGKAEAVIVQIIEDTDILAPPPAKTKPNSPEPEPHPQSDRAVSPLNKQLPPPPPRHPPAPVASPPPRGHSNSLPGPPKSPVAIRSMFPVYNPAVPLSKQNYFPQRAGGYNAPQGAISRVQRSPSSSSSAAADNATGGPKTVPASVVNFPSDALNPIGTEYSSKEDLELLWEATNGQVEAESLGTFNLKLSKIQPGTFTFGSYSAPFYTLQTFSTNELGISRSHPRKQDSKLSIMTLDLEECFGRHSSSGGLVAELFPELAGMLATDQAAELAKAHNLAPSVALEVESNAINRAAAQESCRLIRNQKMGRYELQHPALDKQPMPNQIGEDGLPRSPVQTQEPGTLHINISKPCSRTTAPRQPPTILVTDPTLPNDAAARLPASPRTSTLPLSDADEPLASLDLGTNTLSLSVGLISSTIPSLYAIDALVSAVLAVAVTDEVTNPLLANMQLSTPGDSPPTPPRRPLSAGHSIATTTKTTKTYTGNLFATFAEREDAKQEEQLMSQVRRSSRWKSFSKPKGKEITEIREPLDEEEAGAGAGTDSKSKTKQKIKKKKIVIEEFDLEDYGRYGSRSSREGKKLPGVTRSLVRVIFWVLRFVVWGITLVAKSIARVLVSVTTCVTSDKF